MAKKTKTKKSRERLERKRERLPPNEPVGVQATKPGSHGKDGDLPATPEKYGARPSAATICRSCGHAYIKPCNDDEKRKAKCGNWQWLVANGKTKGKKK